LWVAGLLAGGATRIPITTVEWLHPGPADGRAPCDALVAGGILGVAIVLVADTVPVQIVLVGIPARIPGMKILLVANPISIHVLVHAVGDAVPILIPVGTGPTGVIRAAVVFVADTVPIPILVLGIPNAIPIPISVPIDPVRRFVGIGRIGLGLGITAVLIIPVGIGLVVVGGATGQDTPGGQDQNSQLVHALTSC
jgi:hypothetical protein